MAKIPRNPSDIFDEFTQSMKSVFGDELISIILYGSAATGNYYYKKSDINFLVLLSETGIQKLSACIPAVNKWKKRKVSTPLFLSREYIQSSLDSFPIEFFGMKTHHQLVYGEDILSDLEIDTQHLRLQCERELKGKLLHLREGFLAFGQNKKALR